MALVCNPKWRPTCNTTVWRLDDNQSSSFAFAINLDDNKQRLSTFHLLQICQGMADLDSAGHGHGHISGLSNLFSCRVLLSRLFQIQAPLFCRRMPTFCTARAQQIPKPCLLNPEPNVHVSNMQKFPWYVDKTFPSHLVPTIPPPKTPDLHEKPHTCEKTPPVVGGGGAESGFFLGPYQEFSQ